MKASYQGNNKPFTLAIYAEENKSKVIPLLENMEGRGINFSYEAKNVSDTILRKANSVLLFVSSANAADPELKSVALRAKTNDHELICVFLDNATLDDTLSRVLYTTNAIFAERYTDDDQLVDRIMTSEALQNPKITPAQNLAARNVALLLILSALLVAGFAAYLIFQQIAERNVVIPTATPLPPTATTVPSPTPTNIPVPGGMTQEDLEKITTLILIGDQRIPEREYQEAVDKDGWVSQFSFTDGSGQRIWHYDGSDIPRGTNTNWDFLQFMPNLRELWLFNQSDIDRSALSNMGSLRRLELHDTVLSGEGSISGTASVQSLGLSGWEISDLSAFSEMTELYNIDIDQTDISDLSPLADCKAVKYFSFDGKNSSELRNLNGLDPSKLLEIELLNLPMLSDISAIVDAVALKQITITNAPRLTSVDALAGKLGLERLDLEDVPIDDLSPVSDSVMLDTLTLGDTYVGDLSFTSGFGNLYTIQLYNNRIDDFDFLNELDPQNSYESVDLSLHAERINDWSGLSAFSNYKRLSLNSFNGQNYSELDPYLQELKVESLELYGFNDLDFSRMPRGLTSLALGGGNLRDLEGIENVNSEYGSLYRLRLDSLNYLNSLKGLDGLGASYYLDLEVENCVRLTDLEELYDLQLGSLTIRNGELPVDYSRLKFRQMSETGLEFDNAWAYNDLNFLNDIPEEEAAKIKRLALRNMDQITDLTPAERFKLTSLIIPQSLEQQAKSIFGGNVEIEVYFSTNEFEMDNSGITLLSLDELETLSPTILARVRELTIVGDQLIDPQMEYWIDRWEDDGPSYYVVDSSTGEETHCGPGPIENFEQLQVLTGLESLQLMDQPITDLSGIQNLANLRELALKSCDVSDVSPAFALTGLECLWLNDTPLSSIQGVQNLEHLRGLDLNETDVTDISPLTEVDFTFARENDGMELQLNVRDEIEDYSALSSIGRFSNFSISNTPAENWLPYLEGSEVRSLWIEDTQLENEDIAEIAKLSGLEELSIKWNQNVTDLTPLLDAEYLMRVYVSGNMREAIASVEGRSSFELEMDEDSGIMLLSLDELETLPAETLAGVSELTVVGDHLMDPFSEHWDEEWQNGSNKPVYAIVNNETGERTYVGAGSIASVEQLSSLTGLENLSLLGQPLSDLNGIQKLSELRVLQLNGSSVSDISAAFELLQLERISLTATPVTSIHGIQNLKHLQELTLNSVSVVDLTPLKETDLTYARENDGFNLFLKTPGCQDYSAIASVGKFSSLSVLDAAPSLWLPYLEGSEVRRLWAESRGQLTNADVVAIARLGGLEELDLTGNSYLTDLTPLLDAPELRVLRVSANIAAAVNSIQDQAGFEIQTQE